MSIDHTAALDALRAAGLMVETIDWDAGWQRVPTRDKPNSKNGAYIAYSDAPASLWWHDWASGESGKWAAKGQRGLTAGERAELSRRMVAARKAREEERSRVHAESAAKARAIYAAAADCTGHPYLERKGVKPVPGLKLHKGAVVVPLYDDGGKVASLQFIDADGSKRFLTGGRKRGCFFPLGGKDADKPLLIAEGYATAASLHECLSLPVLVAFDADNLQPVAEMARARYPARAIILAADNDTGTDGNPGVAKATAAALAVGGSLAVPRHEGRAVDWNDLHCLMGAGEVRTQFMTHRKPETTAATTDTSKEKLPSGFSLRSGGSLPGLWHTEVKEEGDPVETWVGAPLSVLGETRDENGNSWGLLLEWQDRDGKTHTWAMSKALLVGKDSSAWLGRLVDEGWSAAAGQRARNLLARFLSEYLTDRRVRCVDRTGWHYGAFVFPDTIIQNMSDVVGRVGRPYSDNGLEASDKEKSCRTLSDGLSMPDIERIVLQVRTAHNPFRMAGTPDGWRSTIGEWSRGNSRLMLAVCASLAAPLLHLAGQDSGGFNWTGQSSTGKTTALVAAGSVWGKGASSGGYVQNWRATSNGLEGLAALHSDAALCLDEIGQAPGRTIMEASYMLANGMGKSRAHQDGSAKAVKYWRCLVLSTGEKGLAEKIAEEGGRVQAGQTVRLIDVPADAEAGMGIFEDLHGHESPQAFAEAIKQAAATHYGHAARAFITALLNEKEALTELHAFLAGGLPLLCPNDASGQVRRVTRRFLLCAAAGEMAVQWGLLPWDKREALQAVKTCFDAWVALRGGTGAAEDTAIVEQVMLFIEQHGASRFQDIDNPAATCINRVGFRRHAGDGTEFLILPESFKAELCKGHNAKRAAALLLEKGMLIPGEGRNLMRRSPVDLPGYGRKRCYTILVNGGWHDAVD